MITVFWEESEWDFSLKHTSVPQASHESSKFRSLTTFTVPSMICESEYDYNEPQYGGLRKQVMPVERFFHNSPPVWPSSHINFILGDVPDEDQMDWKW